MSNALTKSCPCCDGSGQVLDSAQIGAKQKTLREQSGVTLKEVSELLNLSIGYISDLENGRPGKQWTEKLIRRHTEAIHKAARSKQKAK